MAALTENERAPKMCSALFSGVGGTGEGARCGCSQSRRETMKQRI